MRLRAKRLSPTWFLVILLFSLATPLLSPQTRSNGDAWDWKTRDSWQRPQQVMDTLGLKSGSVVADLGCGNGYFTFHLADRVGTSGKVYAVDVRENLVEEIRRSAKEKRLPQIDAIVGATDDPHLPPGSLDAILIVNAYHEFSDYSAMMEHSYQALKPGGRLAVIDFLAEPGRPRAEYVAHHKISPELVKQELEHRHFRFVLREADILIPGESREFFFLLFDKPAP
jgi:predicted methyltransferase